MNILRVVVAQTRGFEDWAVAYVVIGDWKPPIAENDPTFGEPIPEAPTGRPKLKEKR
jgi:hypothetical protein